MIVNYSPALFSEAKRERKPPMRLISFALQMPAPNGNRCIVAQDSGFQIRKSQRSHFFARVVVFLVTIMHGLPASRYCIAGDKRDIRRPSVAIHVGFNFAPIPCISLSLKYGLHSGNDCFVAS